ncbi:hypothetical protein [Hymenobacter coccineus]|uniref:Uncharacterized protein n=1 Tax=Hymenobacter coccineus TaxID=1908235 RepID=A0A1G1T485_9BACT|nr:hypothetical protein [Hymenobacter coccineus]OGX85692.1 hypothetical protein BEN49_11040 [Hymenobacter coccineus]
MLARPCLGPAPAENPPGPWSGGLGVGNGLELHAAYQTDGHLLLLGRNRYKWWGPSAGPGSKFFDNVNVLSRQIEVAALAGYGAPVGRSRAYAAAGLAYVLDRQLGDYRYTTRSSGLLWGDATYHYAYRRYQALGLPLEIGLQGPLGRNQQRLGLAFQANLNPEHSVYCALLTLNLSSWGNRIK